MKSVKIYTRLLHFFRNSEHFDFFKFIVSFIVTRISGIPEILQSWNVFNGLFEKEDVIFKKSAAAIETKYIADLNSERHSLFTLFRRKVSLSEISLDATERDAAVKLNEVLTNYKSIGKAPMVEVSALIINMLQDLDKPRYATPVTTLDLSDVISKLEAANDKFRSLYQERFQNLETSEELGTMKDIRLQVDKAFKTFTQGLDAVYVVGKLSGKDVTAAEEIIEYINAAIDQYGRVLSHRGYSAPKKSDNNNDENEDGGTPVEPTIPTLAVEEQNIDGDFTMTLIISDQPAFEAILYPVAKGGMLKLTADPIPDAYDEFPIRDFEMQSGKPIGMWVNPPRDDLDYDRPLNSFGPCEGDVYDKEGELLAHITNLQWPTTHSH
ncbi:MAG: DUF6261 family protein [Tannerellaceae bacterium]|jgi:hypothetical protein|nr:DUF6261 family protein [Tannerellaceae bacterium]